MKFLSRLSLSARLLWASVLAWFPGGYEGSRRHNPDFPSIPGAPQDAQYDADPTTRSDLVHMARWHERNSPIVNALVDKFEQYTVGAMGLQVLPDSSDEVWNQSAKTSWDIWCQYCDLTSRMTFGTIQSLVARSWFIDGEIFIRKTRELVPTREVGKPIYRPRIQLLECHRIETPPHLVSMEGSSVIDGIEVNSIGRPTAYWYRKGGATGYDVASYERIPADEIIHVFEPSRPGQPRGLSFLYPVIPQLRGLDLLQLYAMRAAADQAEKSTIIKTQSGEVSPGALIRQEMDATARVDTAGAETLEQRVKWVQKTIGGRALVLRSGEDASVFGPNRPTQSEQQHWDILTSQICVGTGISKLLVFPESMQGTVVRADLDIAATFFRARFAVLADAFRRVYEFVMDFNVRYDGALDGAPNDGTHLNCIIRPPRAPNVDVGRNSAAMLAELQANARTYESVYAELGQDWRREFKQCAKEAAYFLRVCDEEKVAPVLVRTAIAAALLAEMQQKEAERAEEEDSDESEPVDSRSNSDDA